jgi:uncharacterized membrane protein
MDQFTFTQKEIDDGKVMAGIAYFGFIGFLIAYLVGKENRFTLYHAQQGLVLAIALLLSPIPIIGWLWGIGCLVLFIMGLLNGFGGKVAPLPLLGPLAFKFGLLKPDQAAAPQA